MKLARTLTILLIASGFAYLVIGRKPAELRGAQVAVKTADKTGTVKTAPAKTAAKTATKKSAKEEKPPTNPLGRLIRGLIPRGNKPLIPKHNNRTIKIPTGKTGDDPASRARSLRARDPIDSRAPHDPDDVKRLRLAQSSIAEGEWESAMVLLQRLLDRKDDSLIRNKDEEWVSVRDQANRLLGRSPPQVREAYEIKYGTAARDRLDAALQSGDLKSVADVATRYFHTKAGAEAAAKLCAIYLDRGEYGPAARWHARVLESEMAEKNDPHWLLQAAYAFRRAGDDPESRQLLKKVQALRNGGSLVVGGKPVQPAEWLKKFRPAIDGPQTVSEWWNLFGNPSRTATLSGGEPLLLARWKQPTTNSHPVRRHIERLLETLADNRRAMIPAAIPLTVDGKVVYRTMRGVNVVDAETGDLLWETREGVSAERLLSGMPAGNNYSNRFVSRRMSSRTYSYGDQHPLTSLLFRNGNYGLLSSDGRRLFVIEDQALMPGVSSYYGSDPEQNDRYRRSWLTNKLTAYDLKTGRPLWEAGGRKRNESFDLPLAGNYFLGVPVAHRGELFLVGEQDSRVRLHVLDAATGKPKWSRLIAYSDTKISQDSVRRWFTAQVAVSDGVVVCPTTVGWMVAVDRTNRSILWAQRYSKPSSREHVARSPFGRTSNVPITALNERWVPSAPVVTAGHVVYTPQEDESIVCARLRDGKRLWRIPKGEYLYLAGVFGDNVVLVGKEKITAVKLRAGTTAWTCGIDKAAGMPSGMGVATDGRYHVPLHSGQLWTLDVKTGKVTGKLYLPRTSRPLGNLTMYRGQVLSFTPFGMTSFEQRAALLARIAARRKQSPRDAWAALKEAEIALLKRDFEKSLTTLRGIDAGKLEPRSRPRFRSAMLRSLRAAIRSDFKAHDAEARQLESFVRTPAERFQFRRLTAERHDARGELPQAFAAYRRLADEYGGRVIPRSDEPRLEVQLRAWAAGKLHDVWDRMSPANRKTVGADLTTTAAKLAKRPLQEQLQFARLFLFHPAAVGVVNRVVEQSARNGEFGRAERLLSWLRRHPDVPVAAAATERFARLLSDRKLRSDAAVVYAALAQKHGNVKLPGGRTGAALVAELRKTGALESDVPKPLSWAATSMRIEQAGTQYQSYPNQGLLIGASRFPFFREHSFEIDHSHQQLVVGKVADDSLVWLVPLRSAQSTSSNQYTYGTTFGHFLLVMHRNVLHCLSPLDKRVVWTRKLENRMPTSYFSYYSSSPTRGRYRPLQDGGRVATTNSLANAFAQQGGLAFANARHVGLYGRRRLLVLDAATGEVVWTLRGLRQGSKVVATADAVFVLNNGEEQVVALRAVDGRRLSDAKAAKIVSTAVGVAGNEFLVPDAQTTSFLGLRRSTTTWKLQDPLTGAVRWKKSFASGSSFALLDDGNIVALPRKGELEIVNRATGRSTTYPLTADALRRSRQIYVLADRNTLFVVANGGSRSRFSYSYGGLTTIPVYGEIHAFDRQTRKRLWKKSVSNQQLVMDHFALSPVLAFNTQSYVRKGLIQHQTLAFQAIDKRTGKTLINKKVPSNYYYGSFTVNLRDRYVEFRTYNNRLRLVAVAGDRPPVAAKRATP